MNIRHSTSLRYVSDSLLKFPTPWFPQAVVTHNSLFLKDIFRISALTPGPAAKPTMRQVFLLVRVRGEHASNFDCALRTA